MSAPKSILLDNDFLSDVRVRALVRALGFEKAIARFVHLLTRFNDEAGEMEMRHALLLGDMIGVGDNEWTSFLMLCLDEKILLQDGETLFIKRILKDSKNVELKRKTWRDKKRVQRGQAGTSPGTSEEELEQEEEQEVLDKKNGAAWHPQPPYDTPPIVKALTAWDAKQQSQKPSRRLDQIQLDALCMKFGNPDALLAALVHSCSLSSARNVYPPPEPNARGSPPKHNKSVTKVLELMGKPT